MRLQIDTDVCAGHGRCYALFPDLFAPDDEGLGVGVVTCVHPTGGQLDDAELAVASCPEGAIALIDDPQEDQ